MKRTLLLVSLLCIALSGASAQDNAPGARGRPSGVASSSRFSQEFEGEVVATYDNEEFVLKHPQGYLVVKMDTGQWALGLARGCTVRVTGDMKPDSFLENELRATKIEIVSRPKYKPLPFTLDTLRQALDRHVDGDVVGVTGTIEDYGMGYVRVSDGADSMQVEFAKKETWRKDPANKKVLVVGVLQKTGIQHIDAIVIRPMARFASTRQGEPTTPEQVQSILTRRPIGQLVRAQGQLRLFISATKQLYLEGDSGRLIIYLAEQYAALPRTGDTVQVVGVFAVENREGKEFGVLREARIDTLQKTKAIQTKE
jgi:hypothetical protein